MTSNADMRIINPVSYVNVTSKAKSKEVIKDLIRTDLLRGKIAEKGFTQSGMAKILGISGKSFYNKMQKGIFKSDEIQKMIEVLDIDNPIAYFFAQEVTSKQLNKDVTN